MLLLASEHQTDVVEVLANLVEHGLSHCQVCFYLLDFLQQRSSLLLPLLDEGRQVLLEDLHERLHFFSVLSMGLLQAMNLLLVLGFDFH